MIWGRLKYFKPTENWGNPHKMNGLLLLLLDEIRDLYGKPFVIHCGYAESGHVKGSQHYVGNAVDFHIVDERPFKEQVERLTLILGQLQVASRVGLGIYPDWVHPGFHLDVRGKRARWGRIGDRYVAFSEALKYADMQKGGKCKCG